MLKRIESFSAIKLAILSLTAAFLLFASSAQAQWVLLDDFQSYTDGDFVVNDTTPNVGSGATWDGTLAQPNQHFFATDPDCAANVAMRIGVSPTGGNGNSVTRAQITDSANYIAAGATGTVFWRFRVPVAATGTLDHVVGLTDNATIGNFNFKSGLRNVGNNSFDLRDGGDGYENVVPTLVDNTWYNFWMVSTNTNPGTMRCYLQSDDDPAYATQTELVGADPWDYRINGATDIINVYFRGASNAGGVAGNDLYIDDLYIDPAASNLSNPAVAVVCNTMVLKGDVDMDGDVDFSDIPAFIAVLQASAFQAEADCDCSTVVNFSDIPVFISILQNQ